MRSLFEFLNLDKSVVDWKDLLLKNRIEPDWLHYISIRKKDKTQIFWKNKSSPNINIIRGTFSVVIQSTDHHYHHRHYSHLIIIILIIIIFMVRGPWSSPSPPPSEPFCQLWCIAVQSYQHLFRNLGLNWYQVTQMSYQRLQLCNIIMLRNYYLIITFCTVKAFSLSDFFSFDSGLFCTGVFLLIFGISLKSGKRLRFLLCWPNCDGKWTESWFDNFWCWKKVAIVTFRGNENAQIAPAQRKAKSTFIFKEWVKIIVSVFKPG